MRLPTVLDISIRPKTAFIVPGRPHYQFTVMPFGLCNAAHRICRLMEKVKEEVFVYSGDLLIVSANLDKHCDIIQDVGIF